MQLGAIAMKHDASRVMQSIMQHGADDQRNKVLEAIGSKFVPLAKSKYGHQLVAKCLRYGSKELKEKILKEFRGNVVRLATHHLGALTLEEGFVHGWTTSQSLRLLKELYGPDFILLPEVSGASDGQGARSLDKLFVKHPNVKESVLSHIAHVVQKAANKALLGLTFLHRLVQDYLEFAEVEDKRKFIPNITDAVVALVSSKPGTRAVILALGFGSAKERKAMMQYMKPHALEMATHDQGHVVLLKALACVDDTVLLRKCIFKELSPEKEKDSDEANPLLSVCLNQYGKKVILQPLAPHCRTYFTQFDLDVMKHHTMNVNKNSETDVQYTSKKDDQVRQKELITSLKPIIQPLCLANSYELIMNKHGSDVLLEATWQWGLQDVVEDLCGHLRTQITNIPTNATKEEIEHATPLIHHPSAHLFFKRLILREARNLADSSLPQVGGKDIYLGRDGAKKVTVSEEFYKEVGCHIEQLITTNRGAFVVAALLEHPSVNRKLAGQIRKSLPEDAVVAPGKAVLKEAVSEIEEHFS